jgi:hypothetical protein
MGLPAAAPFGANHASSSRSPRWHRAGADLPRIAHPGDQPPACLLLCSIRCKDAVAAGRRGPKNLLRVQRCGELLGSHSRAGRGDPECGLELCQTIALKDHLAFYPGMVDECWVDEERVVPQPGDFYGGWITSDIKGPFKGPPGTLAW